MLFVSVVELRGVRNELTYLRVREGVEVVQVQLEVVFVPVPQVFRDGDAVAEFLIEELDLCYVVVVGVDLPRVNCETEVGP